MKKVIFFISIIFISQTNLSAMGLEKAEFDEFLQNKKRIVQLGRQLPNHESNRLLAAYARFATNEEDVLQKLDEPTLQGKIKEMYEATARISSYIETMRNALEKKTQEDWDKFRYTNGRLLREFLATKGFILTNPKDLTRAMLEANKDIHPEAAEYAIASSFLIYYTRGIQRNVTGKQAPSFTLN